MHVHFDAATFVWTGVTSLVFFHLLRIGGAWLAAHGAGKAGTLLGGLATFG